MNWLRRLFPPEIVPPEPEPLECRNCGEPVYPWYEPWVSVRVGGYEAKHTGKWHRRDEHNNLKRCEVNLLRQIRDYR